MSGPTIVIALGIATDQEFLLNERNICICNMYEIYMIGYSNGYVTEQRDMQLNENIKS